MIAKFNASPKQSDNNRAPLTAFLREEIRHVERNGR